MKKSQLRQIIREEIQRIQKLADINEIHTGIGSEVMEEIKNYFLNLNSELVANDSNIESIEDMINAATTFQDFNNIMAELGMDGDAAEILFIMDEIFK
jgi:hypothetical protein